MPPVAIEKHQIQQVFVNVFMNAIQAMGGCGPGQAVLTVQAQRSPDSDGALLVNG